ncbi:MAG TPA: glycerol-3-phosphate 1-O-acyltransferase PlsY [Caulobacteraceae bacterium]|nr:glycerol-3-phosphate 1-O-acyltransferase PlsY [Caulobacteraceae bacterium]
MIAACVLGGYLIGSISFGLIAARIGGLGDIRQIGSGNIGATNVLRSGRKDLALFTLVGDAGKGGLAILLAWLLGRGSDQVGLMEALAGGAAFFGHCFPIWLRFKGGKGMATFLGVMLAAWWPAGALCCLTWLIVAAIFRISSLSALAAAALSPLFVLATKGLMFDKEPRPFWLMALFLAVLIFIRHHQNIGRLLKGQEPRIGANKA